ncbi:hypothetical protein BWQ96_01265 [Gracilariopsis chorda]|uniref:Uncharacterized protein n=1 Tax=Gracilariopsis chorda TaxID=448386 RepID=A0A2V3J3L3_9FLOR|nr:hypothetical protein BWQ96_01265 [Gracilariopsis chorda]|eukprot:PXF48923.1 hypothetical protein BWQ96_01265 [Gracilariopsis chorda]
MHAPPTPLLPARADVVHTSIMQSQASAADHRLPLHNTSCLRLCFSLQNAKRRPYSIHLSVPSHHISLDTEQTVFNTFVTTLPLPICAPSTPVTLRLLHKHHILSTVAVTYAELLSSLKHRFTTTHGAIVVYAAPHAPELATLRAQLRIASRGILNAPRVSTTGDCIVTLSYRCAGVWIPFYRSASPNERQAGGELLSYGPEQGTHTHVRVDAFRLHNSRITFAASVELTLDQLLEPDTEIALLNQSASKGYIKIRTAELDKVSARLVLDAFLFARTPDTDIAVIPPTSSRQSPVNIHASDMKHTANVYDFRAPGFRSFFRGLFSSRRRKKLNQAALMVVGAVENDTDQNQTQHQQVLPF